MRFLTHLLRVLLCLFFLVIVLLNTSRIITVPPLVSHILVFVFCLLAVAAMLVRTLRNRENNTSRTNYGFKLIVVLLLFLISVTMFVLELLR